MNFRIRYIPISAMILAALWISFILLAAYRRGYSVALCPSCRSDRLRPSWPRWRDRYFFVYFGVTPQRCEACQKRFYIRK